MPSRILDPRWRWAGLIAAPVVAVVVLSMIFLPQTDTRQASGLPIIEIGATNAGNEGPSDAVGVMDTAPASSAPADSGFGTGGSEDPLTSGTDGNGPPVEAGAGTGTTTSATTTTTRAPAGALSANGGSSAGTSVAGAGPGTTQGPGAGSSSIVTSGIRIQNRGQSMPAGSPASTGTSASTGSSATGTKGK